jgi:hypothetical protein
MFPAVVIDLGMPVEPAEAAFVLEACNAAIVAGSCQVDAAGSEPPEALAIVRWSGPEQRRVRIEVGLREADHSAWSVREIAFAPGDPVRERWRSVGLVVATLVGELDPAPEPQQGTRPEAQVESKRSAPAAAGSEQVARAKPAPAPAAIGESTPSPARPSVPPSMQAATPSDAATPTPEVHALTRLPLLRPAIFVAAGVLAGEGADFDPLRWIAPSGWALSIAADYSRFDLGSALDAAWLRIAAGAGYHVWLAERWSAELNLELGARALSVEPNAAGSIQSTSWSPQGALRAEAWFQALSGAGVWAGVTASTIGRQTRMLGTDSQPEVVVPLVELHGMLGLWWAP